MHSRGLWALLERCPFPEDVMTLKISALKEMIGRASRRGLEASQKAIAVFQAAKESIGLRQIGSADRYRLKMCLEEAKRTELTIKDIEREIKRTLKEIPEAEYLLSIPGIGPISAAVFLGELGNASYFPSARQVVKYAGYDPQESDSGYRVSRKFISKKGRWLLRKHLFLMSMRVVVLSRYFQEYYQRKLQTKNRFGQLPRKKEILCAVAIKLIKVIFALLRDKRNFEDTITCSVE
jgi:transposase